MRYVVGIDAGGTKTVGLLADETGAVVAEARGTGANLQTDGELQVEKVFDQIMETLSAHNPGIVYASISGYGSTGPWAGRRAYAPVVGAETGITKEQGDARGGHYANDPFSHADVYTALETASAILAALFNRERTGRGDTESPAPPIRQAA